MQLSEGLLVLLVDGEAGHSKLVVNHLRQRIGEVAVSFLYFDEDLPPLSQLVCPRVLASV